MPSVSHLLVEGGPGFNCHRSQAVPLPASKFYGCLFCNVEISWGFWTSKDSSDVDLCCSTAECAVFCKSTPGVLRWDSQIYLNIKILRCQFVYYGAVFGKAFNRWQTYEGGVPAINSWVLCCFTFLCGVERIWSRKSSYLDCRLRVLIRRKKGILEDKWDALKSYWVFKSSWLLLKVLPLCLLRLS